MESAAGGEGRGGSSVGTHLPRSVWHRTLHAINSRQLQPPWSFIADRTALRDYCGETLKQANRS